MGALHTVYWLKSFFTALNSKIFERLILNRILELEELNHIDIINLKTFSAIDCSILELNALIASLICQKGKQGI